MDTILAWALIVWVILALASFVVPAEAGDPGMDVPVKPVKLGDERPNHIPTPDPPQDDDPRDTPPPTIYGEDILSSKETVVFVLDRSGSMSLGRPNSRLDRAKRELAIAVSSLPDNWEFGICTYGTSIWHLAPKLIVASPVNKAAAIKWVNKCAASGSTHTGPAMVDSFSRYDSDYYVLITDGAPANGTQFTRDMIKNGNTDGAVIDVFGVEATGEFRAFCQAVAAESGGAYFDVP